MCKQKELKGGEVERLSGKLRADFPAFVFLFMIADFILFCLAPYLLENCWSEAAFGFNGASCVCVCDHFTDGKMEAQEDKDLHKVLW